MDVRKTKAGWVIEVTHMRDGCLEQGGICGREELYKRATLAKGGIDYDADPQAIQDGYDATPEQRLRHSAQPDRVLKAGEVIA